MYASQTKRLCVRGAPSDETTRVQHHSTSSSSSEATTDTTAILNQSQPQLHHQPQQSSSSSLNNHHQQRQLPQTSQPSRATVGGSGVAGGNMTASAASSTGGATESSANPQASISSAFPCQPSSQYHEQRPSSGPLNASNATTVTTTTVPPTISQDDESVEHQLINRLAGETIEEVKLELLLSIRNLITACNRKKDSIVFNPNFCKILSLIDDDRPSPTVKTQLALLLCSVAKAGEHNVRVLNNSFVDDKIFNLILNTQDHALIEACLRCMRSMMSWPKVSRTWLLYENNHTTNSKNSSQTVEEMQLNKNILNKIIVYAQKSDSMIVQECVADIFAATCSRNKDQILLFKANALQCIVELLESPSQRVVIASLNWLMQMCLENNLVSLEVSKLKCPSGQLILDALTSRMSKDNCFEMQFLAARCYTNIYRASINDTSSKAGSKVASHVIPTLVRMVHSDKLPQLRIKAAECIAYLIERETRLQSAASICDHLIESLANMLEHEHYSLCFDAKSETQSFYKCIQLLDREGSCVTQQSPPYEPRQSLPDSPLDRSIECEVVSALHLEMKRAAFLALASLASNVEPVRKKVFNTCSIMQHLVRGLSESDTKTLKATLTCLLSLSRSVQQLRTGFAESSVYSALKGLLTTTSNDVLILVLAILCNISLDFSPGKQHFLDDNTIETLCKLTRESNSLIRLHGMWILMNMVYQLKDEGLKFRILRSLGVKHVLGLLETGDDDEIVIKTLGFLRNLLSQKVHIDSIMSSHGDQIVQSLVRVLDRPTSARIKEQTLCVLTNIADGSDSKSFIMKNQTILSYLTRIISDEQAGDLRLAAICCITNLAHKENEGSTERRDEMKRLGIEEKLKSMLTTNDPILSDRVRTAYNQFSIEVEDKYVN